MKTLLFSLLFISCFADNFIRFPYPGLPSKDIDGKQEYSIFRKKQQAYLLINMLRVDPQGFVRRYMRPVIADDSWKLLFKTEAIRLKKFPDYYPLYQDALLEQTATHARLGESFANVRARLAQKLPKKLDGFVPGYKPLKLLAQTLMWKTKTQNDFFSYLCHGHFEEANHCGRKDLVLAGCKPDYINRKTPRGRIRFLLRPSGAVGCNNVDTLVKNDNLFACDVTYPDYSPRLRVKSPMIAGNWFYNGIGQSRIYAVVIHVPRHEKITKVQLVIDGKIIDMPMTLQNGVSRVYSVAYTPLKVTPSLMKGYFFHAEINGKNFFYPAQFYYDWEQNMNLTEKQRYNGFCKVPFPDRTCEICDAGYRVVKGDCVKCTMDNCDECNQDVCTKCTAGFLLSGGECKTKCMENCTICTSASTCKECKKTHYLGTNGTCIECSTKFHDCATCTQDKCLTYLCQHNDPTCNLKKTPGQYFSETTQKCEKCSEGCDECEFDHFKGSKCTLCKNGLFLTSEGECIPCHYVDGCVSGQCDGNKCLECQRGYHRSGKGCKRCPEGCGKCDDNGKCLACAFGFILDKEYGKCVEHYEIEHCAKKSGHGVCIKCEPGYGFDKFSKCVACDASCKQCHYADVCEVCKDTFFNVNGHCEPCSKRGCDLCDAQECFSCQPHSYLHNGVCVRGPPGCSLCHDKAPICRVCEKGMKMKDGHCIPDCDIKNCAKCNGDETCRYCKSTLTPYGGYEPAPNGTEPCPFVCDPIELNCLLTEKMKTGQVEACFSLGCKFCPPHTFRKDHKCVKCDDGCDKCLNDKECIKCLPGYSYHMGKCYKCNKEGTCGEGEYMDGCACKECKKKYEHCLACDNEQCIVCEPNFVLSVNKTACVPCVGKLCIRPRPQPYVPRDPECPESCDKPEEPEPEPNEKPEPEQCTMKENFTIAHGTVHFDPACKERFPDCYCRECMCGYRLSKDNHTCEEIPLEERVIETCPEGEEWDGCKCVNPCPCGRNENDTCIEKPAAIDNCLRLGCKGCEECDCGFFLNGTQCSTCPVNSTLAECQKPCKNCTETCTCGRTFKNETSGKCEPCPTSCATCVYYEEEVKCVTCEDGSIALDGTCARTLSMSRSAANGVSIIFAVVMALAIFI